MLIFLRNFLATRPTIFAFLRRAIELGYRTQKKIIKEVFGESENKKVLDIGCGTGEFAPLFKNADYYGIDISFSYIAYAKKKNKGKFLVMDATKLEFNNDVFDQILIMAILHHLEIDDVKKILIEAKRVLKSDGKILILEDVKIEQLDNFIVRFVQKFDVGNFIRIPEEYKDIVLNYFKIVGEWRFRNGGCTYYGLLLEK